MAFSGLGVLIYFTTKNKTTENKTPTTEQRVQQLHSQLAQIRTALATLSQNITQTETSLQTKRTEYQQSPENSLQTEINQLESQLTTYKTQKQKIEVLLPKIQEQINNLAKGTDSESKNQEDIIQNLEKDIQEINQELGIKTDKPKPTPRKLPDDKKPDKPTPDRKPDDNSPQAFQTLQRQAEELQTEIIKINQKYQQERDKWNSKPEMVRDMADAMTEGRIKKLIASLTSLGLSDLEQWISDSEYQKFLTLSPEAQKKNVELVESVLNSNLKVVSESLAEITNHFKGMIKFSEQMFNELEKEFGQSPESIQGRQEVQKQKDILTNCEIKLNEPSLPDSQNLLSEGIANIREVWKGLEQLEWNKD